MGDAGALRIDVVGWVRVELNVVGVQRDWPAESAGAWTAPVIQRPVLRAEEQRGKLVQAPSPGEPLVVRTRRFVEDGLDAGLRESVVESADAVLHALRLGGTDA